MLALRRAGKGRRPEDDVIPVLDWFKDEREAAKLRERKRRLKALLIFLLALLPVGAVNLYLHLQPEKEPPPKRPKVEATPDPFELMQMKKKEIPRTRRAARKKAADKRASQMARLRNDILNIAPEIYGEVRLELISGSYMDETDVSAAETEDLTVNTIEIQVKSGAWNRMTSDEKVKLLHDTFSLLRARYPALTRFVKLKFDDGRKDLEIRFDDEDLLRKEYDF